MQLNTSDCYCSNFYISINQCHCKPYTKYISRWAECVTILFFFLSYIEMRVPYLKKKKNEFKEIPKRTYTSSAVSRAILKSVYRIGIPNSNPQTLKSVNFWCKLSSAFLVAESRERCFELIRMTPLGRAYSAASDSPAAQRFFSSLCLSKNRHPQKIAGYGTDKIYAT